MTDLDDLVHLAMAVAESAGDLLLERLGDVRTQVETKSSGTDMVSEVDTASEALVVAALRRARPNDGFLGEEGTEHTGTTGVRWVVDPLDGTTNYLYGYPAFAVSIAAEVNGAPGVGVVRDPLHAETWAAVRGGGAACNGRPLRVVGPPTLATALLGTGFAYVAERRAEQAARLVRVLPHVRDIRRSGSAALDLCWVAGGRLDAYYERGLQPWDWAGGSLVASEAGASVGTLDDGTAWAAAPQLAGPLVTLLRRAARDASGA